MTKYYKELVHDSALRYGCDICVNDGVWYISTRHPHVKTERFWFYTKAEAIAKFRDKYNLKGKKIFKKSPWSYFGDLAEKELEAEMEHERERLKDYEY